MVSVKYLWVTVAGPLVVIANGFTLTWDPISSTKLAALAVIAGISVVQIFQSRSQVKLGFQTWRLRVVAFFVIALLIPLIFSESPLSQQIYGVAGRNLGFLHYLFLSLIFLGSSLLSNTKVIHNFLAALILTGTIESFHGIFQKYGSDPLPWANPRNEVFGTFGNTNYFSSFLAFSVIALIFYLGSTKALRSRFAIFLLLFLHVYVIVLSNATQGLVLAAFGLMAFVIFQTFKQSRLTGIVSISVGLFSGAFAILGTLQIGPLARFLYQDSITFRGDYWRAGINMFKHNWASGVGLDSYGDFYRLYKDITASERRITGSYPNSAHNLLIDLASTGGVLLLIAYLAIVLLVIFSVVGKVRSKEKASSDYAAVVCIWIAFNLQALISINVSSLAIWGWISAALLVGYKLNTPEKAQTEKVQSRTKKASFRVQIILSSLIGLLSVFPLLQRDFSLGRASDSGIATEISRSVLMFPRDAEQIDAVSEAYKGIGFEKESLDMALAAVRENPRSFRGWELIVKNNLATSSQKKLAGKKLDELDPFLKLDPIAP